MFCFLRHLGASAGFGGRMLASALNGERTLQALGAALDKEHEQWKPVLIRPLSNQVRTI